MYWPFVTTESIHGIQTSKKFECAHLHRIEALQHFEIYGKFPHLKQVNIHRVGLAEKQSTLNSHTWLINRVLFGNGLSGYSTHAWRANIEQLPTLVHDIGLEMHLNPGIHSKCTYMPIKSIKLIKLATENLIHTCTCKEEQIWMLTLMLTNTSQWPPNDWYMMSASDKSELSRC